MTTRIRFWEEQAQFNIKFWDLSSGSPVKIFEDTVLMNTKYIASFKANNLEGFAISTPTKAVIFTKLSCHPSCATCSGSEINNCLTCANGESPVGGMCSCEEGKYFDGIACQACPKRCAACQNNQRCTKCKPKPF